MAKTSLVVSLLGIVEKLVDSRDLTSERLRAIEDRLAQLDGRDNAAASIARAKRAAKL